MLTRIGADYLYVDERLIEVLWGDSPPESATNNLQVYVSRLRNELGRGTIDTTLTNASVAARH
jgi:DNA-binding SARP family transcriptional activator